MYLCVELNHNQNEISKVSTPFLEHPDVPDPESLFSYPQKLRPRKTN